MNVINVRPSGPLQGYVYWLAYYDGFTSDDLTFRMISEGTVDILIPLEGQTTIFPAESHITTVTVTEPALIGPQTSFAVYDTSGASRALGIVFTAGGASRFLEPQLGSLTDSIIPARDLLGPAFRIVQDRLQEEEDIGRMFAIVEAFLNKRFAPKLRYADEIDFAISAIRRGETDNRSLVDFAERIIGFSHKHFVDLFRRHVGLTPKRYQQIIHFNRMLERCRRSPRVTWRELAHTYGYFDTSHLVKDFHRLAGMTPGDYLTQTWSHREVLSAALSGHE